MFIKIKRDTLIIIMLAFLLIFAGRFITYMGYASTSEIDDGVPIAGIIIKGNDIVPIDSIRANVAGSGLRTGSYIQGDMLVTSKREIPINEAITNAETFVMRTTIPGTKLNPIVAATITVDRKTGIVTVNVIEDFSIIKTDLNNKNSDNSGAVLNTGLKSNNSNPNGT
ncbi:MAG: hypothetical protein ACRCVG_05305 [Methanobacteriaceae archaeon]